MAIYDFSISDDVSLSRILDAFIEEGESPSAIVKFLKAHEDCLSDIASRSMLVDRVFCAMFLKDCSAQDAVWLLEHLECIDVIQASYCAWQVLLSANSSRSSIVLDKSLSSIAIKFTRQAYEKTGIRHPHAGYGYAEVKQFDTDIIDNGICPEMLFDSMTPDSISRLLKGIAHSLFVSRIFQLDVFESCTDQVKYLMLQSFGYAPSFVVSKFLKQILTSCIDPAIKYEVVKRNLLSYASAGSWCSSELESSDDVSMLLRKASNYPSIAIQLQLHGEDTIADSIFTLLCLRKYKVLAEMAELDEETMEKNFPIKDLIDYIKNNTCLIDAQKHKDRQEQYAN